MIDNHQLGSIGGDRHEGQSTLPRPTLARHREGPDSARSTTSVTHPPIRTPAIIPAEPLDRRQVRLRWD